MMSFIIKFDELSQWFSHRKNINFNWTNTLQIAKKTMQTKKTHL
jgi:hypothetical protein